MEAMLSTPSIKMNGTSDDNALSPGQGPRWSFDWPSTLSHRIDQVIASRPDSKALQIGSSSSFTYAEMNAHVLRITKSLRALHLGSESRIAVFCDPGADFVCSLLAIMRLGATYIPLDPKHPTQHLSSIVENSKTQLILCHEATASYVADVSAKVQTQSISEVDSTKPVGDEPNLSQSDAPAFVLYTSGSTGTPKGVTLSHGNFRDQIAAVCCLFEMNAEVVLQQSSMGFDVSLHQTFCALTTGGTLVIVSKEARGDPEKLSSLMLDHGVTYTLGVPSEYAVLLGLGRKTLQRCTSWRLMICGGERMTLNLKKDVRLLRLKKLRLINCYGPTEISLASNYGDVDYNNDTTGDELHTAGDSMIGKTCPNYTVYVCDKEGMRLPIGQSGEVCIGGAGVALGYLENETMTKERFLVNNFASDDYKAHRWTRLYRTGDRGRLTEAGDLFYQGRIDGDTQVKLRGHRIELEHIEHELLKCGKGTISQAVVSLRGSVDPTSTEQLLVAFVVLEKSEDSDTDPSKGTAQDPKLGKILESLPLQRGVIPSMIVPTDRLPRTVNGKVDRKALVDIELPDFDPVSDPAVDPSDIDQDFTPIEAELEKIWRLAVSHLPEGCLIGRDTDFFSFGGNSLLLAQVKFLIKKSFDLDLELPDLFKHTTLSTMAELIEGKSGNTDLGEETIDWDEELGHFTSQIQAAGEYHGRERRGHKVSTEGAVVLLTGTTGFLGGEMLKQLEADPRVKTIHCVAIRTKAFEKVRAPPHTIKTKYHAGDLAAPFLGLPGTTFTTLISSVTHIFHVGATVSFLKTYPSLRAANVQSTIELITMATTHRIPLHYISSAGVAHLTDMKRVAATSLREYRPPTDGSDGYVASKWMSELVCEHAAAVAGMRVYIHRPVSIVGNGAPGLDILDNVLKYSKKMWTLPDTSEWTGWFDFLPVDEVASGIIAEALPATTTAANDKGQKRSRDEIDDDDDEAKQGEGQNGGFAKRLRSDYATSNGPNTDHNTSASTNGTKNKVESDKYDDRPNLSYVHHCRANKIAASDLKAYLEQEHKHEYKTTTMADWVTQASQQGLEYVVSSYLGSSVGSTGAGIKMDNPLI